MNRLIKAIFAALMLASCHPYGAEVERALRYAARNRTELEKVLRHYDRDIADSLKLRAACYLIENMPYHTSYPAQPYAEYCAEMDSLFRNCEEGDSIVGIKASAISDKYAERLKPAFDILEITADYLIWNIDYSFEIWRESKYLRHLDFDDFCEYVLPYKCLERQPMSKWKEEWRDKWRGELDRITQIDELRYNVRRAVEAVTCFYRDDDSMLRMKVRQIEGMRHIEILDIDALAAQPYGTCLERSRLGIMTCRSKALPVSFDFTPNWADRGNPHFWNNVYVSRRRNIDYEPFESYLGSYHYSDNAMGKVYRATYAPHPLLSEVLEKGGDIPPSLSQLFMRDVTKEYGRVADISVDLSKNSDTGNGYAYLAVFNNSDWVPADVCRIKRGKAKFSDVQLDILYMVVSYESGRTTPLSSPFIVDLSGRVEYIEADESRTCSIRLYRKYPSFNHIYDSYRYLRGGVIEASNDKKFRNPRIMAEFPKDKILAGEATIADSAEYRYWRLRSSESQSSDFAELYFYDRTDSTLLSGDPIYPKVKLRNPLFDTPEHICDGDPLTYFAVENVDTLRWVGFDFGKPVSIGKVAYIRRGDGNDICPNDEYELYYWRDGGWRLHDKQTARNIYLDFTDVPANGLYYIKCLSRGVQNRTFVHDKGEVKWY